MVPSTDAVSTCANTVTAALISKKKATNKIAFLTGDSPFADRTYLPEKADLLTLILDEPEISSANCW